MGSWCNLAACSPCKREVGVQIPTGPLRRRLPASVPGGAGGGMRVAAGGRPVVSSSPKPAGFSWHRGLGPGRSPYKAEAPVQLGAVPSPPWCNGKHGWLSTIGCGFESGWRHAAAVQRQTCRVLTPTIPVRIRAAAFLSIRRFQSSCTLSPPRDLIEQSFRAHRPLFASPKNHVDYLERLLANGDDDNERNAIALHNSDPGVERLSGIVDSAAANFSRESGVGLFGSAILQVPLSLAEDRRGLFRDACRIRAP